MLKTKVDMLNVSTEQIRYYAIEIINELKGTIDFDSLWRVEELMGKIVYEAETSKEIAAYAQGEVEE